MALSNLLNEPRREIIEQLLGVAALAALFAADYWVVCQLQPKDVGDWAIGLLMVPVGFVILLIVGYLLVAGAHALGEGVCALMAGVGADPRPTERYRRH